MRKGIADIGADDYFNVEVFLNQLKQVLINSNTEKALAVAIVDADGNQVVPNGSGTTLSDNRKAVATAGTALQLIVASTPCKYVMVSADLGNTNPVVVGGSTVVAASDSQRGIVLVPGNDPVRIDISNVNLLYVDAQTNGDAVTFFYVN